MFIMLLSRYFKSKYSAKLFSSSFFSIIMVVACIYCIVIIYIPSIEEQNISILPEPKRCMTTEVSPIFTFSPSFRF